MRRILATTLLALGALTVSTVDTHAQRDCASIFGCRDSSSSSGSPFLNPPSPNTSNWFDDYAAEQRAQRIEQAQRDLQDRLDTLERTQRARERERSFDCLFARSTC